MQETRKLSKKYLGMRVYKYDILGFNIQRISVVLYW